MTEILMRNKGEKSCPKKMEETLMEMRGIRKVPANGDYFSRNIRITAERLCRQLNDNK